MTVDQVFSLIMSWSRRIAALGLLIYILLMIGKLFGIELVPGIMFVGAQETGVLLAGTAYALGKA